MPFVHAAELVTTTDAASFTSPSFTPDAGDLLIVVYTVPRWCPFAGSYSLTDSEGGTWIHNFSLQFNPHPTIYERDRVRIARRTTATTAVAMTVTVTAISGRADGTFPEADADGINLAVIRVRNPHATAFSVGPRQIKAGNLQAGGTTPTLTLDSACLTDNVTICGVSASSQTPSVTPPSGWTERMDTGHATPNCGQTYATRGPGFTGTNLTWDSTCAANYAVWAMEIPHTGIVPPPPPLPAPQVEAIGINSYAIKVLTGR